MATQEMSMKALIFRETGEPKSVLKLEEIPTPPLAPGEALVRVLLSPINASDLHMVRGRYGYQTAAASSVGKFVLQLAQRYRFKTINVVRRREQETIIRNLGGTYAAGDCAVFTEGLPRGSTPSRW
jgi:NADPH:quinone reductase-like Zn-dependent oxidoreductase